MDNRSKKFPLDKPTVLNVLYDTLEQLDFSTRQVDSVRGSLLVRNSAFALRYRITVTPSLNGKETTVEVFPEPDSTERAEWIPALFDEMEALIRTSGLCPGHFTAQNKEVF